MPQVQEVHIDAALTNLSVGYRNAAFIADQLAPVVAVRKQFDRYFIHDAARENFRATDDRRAPGAEANEGALKLVRYLGHKQGEPEAQTIVMEHAWHGRTLATLAATGSEKARKGFDPLPSGFIRVPYNDLSAIETMNVAASLGMTVPDDVSIIGFDNIPESALAQPALTTIDHSIQDQGYEAARMLMREYSM